MSMPAHLWPPYRKTEKLRLTAEVPQRYFSDLNDITNAYFSTGGTDTTYSISELHGKLLSIGRSTATGTSLIPVTFEFDNPGDLVTGLYTEIALTGKTVKKQSYSRYRH